MRYEDIRMGFLEDAMKKVTEAASEKRELIILDSWDTMPKEIDKVERLKDEKVISDIIDAKQI